MLFVLAVLPVVASLAPPVSSTATGSSLDGATIAIDPGHNGRNWAHPEEINRLVDAGTLRKACDTTGTATASGYAEPSFTFDVAVRLRRILRKEGASVVLTRRSNAGWGPCITERAAIGNRAHADAAVSIHADGGPPSGRGFHVIYPPSIRGLTDDIAKPSKCLALAMRHAYRAGTGLPYATYLGGNGLSARSDLGRAQPLRRAEGVRGDREHAESQRRRPAREQSLPGAHRAVDRRRACSVPIALLTLLSAACSIAWRHDLDGLAVSGY